MSKALAVEPPQGTGAAEVSKNLLSSQHEEELSNISPETWLRRRSFVRANRPRIYLLRPNPETNYTRVQNH